MDQHELPQVQQQASSSIAGSPQTLVDPSIVSKGNSVIPVTTSSNGPQTQPQQAQLQAADADLIEKEWVQRAKEVISANRQNPHEQSRQLATLRAEYLKKRYNRDIKLDNS